MTTLEIGQQLVDLIRAQKNPQAIHTLYAPSIVSVEAGSPPGQEHLREQRGIEACLAKGVGFRERNEVHGASAKGPFPNGDRFAVLIEYDLTPKHTGTRTTMTEVALYTVANDKIVREEFFYSM